MIKLIWITPDAEGVMAYCARVSNPQHQDKPIGKLLDYMKVNHHWSPFEMASMCVEINTTRDIARQILRHRSFSFQEFSQRYADVSDLTTEAVIRETRLQDPKNRQSSIPTDDRMLSAWFEGAQEGFQKQAMHYYKVALEKGIAKEQARVFLPEGLTPSRMYMTGTIRSWLHYVDLRTDKGTQREHQIIAEAIRELMQKELPNV